MPFSYSKDDVPEFDLPLQTRQRVAQPVPGVLGELVAQLADPLEPREGLGDLAADRDDLDDGPDQQPQVEGEGDERSHGHAARLDLVRPDPHDRDADDAEQQGRERRDRREARHRARDVAEEPVDALREHEGLPPLGAVGLDHAHARERLGQPARDLRVDLGALPEERTQRLESVEQHEAEERQDRQRDQVSLTQK